MSIHMNTAQAAQARGLLILAREELGLEIPPAVIGAEAALGAALTFDVETPEPPDFWTMGAEEVTAHLEAATAREIRRTAVPPIRGQVIGLLGKRLVGAVRGAGPAWIHTLAPRFAKAGRSFAKLMAELPPNYQSMDALVEAGPKAVEAYQKVKAARDELELLAGVRDDLAALGVAVKGPAPAVEAGTRHCRVETLAAAQRAAGALKTEHPLGPYAALLEVPGVLELRWLPVEAQAAEIAALPEGKAGDRVARTDGFKGTHRLPEVAAR